MITKLTQFRVFLIFITAILGACGSSPKLSEHHSRMMSASEFNIYVDQTSVELDDSNLHGGQFGGGLLGVILSEATNDIREKRADNAFDELREALGQYDLQSEAKQLIQKKLNFTKLPVHIDPKFIKTTPENPYSDSRQNIVDLRTEYKLSNKLDRLIVSTSIRIYDVLLKTLPSGAIKEKFDTHYNASYFYMLEAPEAARVKGSSRRDEYERAWLAYGVEKLKDDILTGVNDTIEMMNIDLETQSQPVTTGKRARFRSRYDQTIAADVIREFNDQVWVYGNFNHYYALKKDSLRSLK